MQGSGMSVTSDSGRRMGKLPFREDRRDIAALSLLSSTPLIPYKCSWEGPTVDSDPLLNDRLGCCTCSAARCTAPNAASTTENCFDGGRDNGPHQWIQYGERIEADA